MIGPAGNFRVYLACGVTDMRKGERDVALARIVWRGGAVTNLEAKLKVNSVAKLTRGMEMRDRVLDLVRDGAHDDKIAAVLTAEGHRSPNCETEVLPTTVQRIRRGAGLKAAEPHRRWLHEASLLSPPELAARLNIPVNWLYVQIRHKRLLIGGYRRLARLRLGCQGELKAAQLAVPVKALEIEKRRFGRQRHALEGGAGR